MSFSRDFVSRLAITALSAVLLTASACVDTSKPPAESALLQAVQRLPGSEGVLSVSK